MSEHKELKAEWKNEVEVKTYKQSDVAKHNTKKDNWIIIHGKGEISLSFESPTS